LECDIPRRGDGRQLHFRSSGALPTADLFSSSNITTTAISCLEVETPVIQSILQAGSCLHHQARWTSSILPDLARLYHHHPLQHQRHDAILHIQSLCTATHGLMWERRASIANNTHSPLSRFCEESAIGVVQANLHGCAKQVHVLLLEHLIVELLIA
jgi:hypothetical protein